jgi:hypothetical protein
VRQLLLLLLLVVVIHALQETLLVALALPLLLVPLRVPSLHSFQPWVQVVAAQLPLLLPLLLLLVPVGRLQHCLGPRSPPLQHPNLLLLLLVVVLLQGCEPQGVCRCLPPRLHERECNNS